MSPKILLTFQAPKKRKLYVNTLPPLGILGIASYLQENNIAVDIFDHNIDNGAGYSFWSVRLCNNSETVCWLKMKDRFLEPVDLFELHKDFDSLDFLSVFM